MILSQPGLRSVVSPPSRPSYQSVPTSPLSPHCLPLPGFLPRGLRPRLVSLYLSVVPPPFQGTVPLARGFLCANFWIILSSPPNVQISPSSSTPNSLSINSIPTSGPTPTNTQFKWLTQISLIFSSISKSVSGGLSLTEPDQVPTVTSFSTAGTPSFAPGVTPLPPGIPARIVPGAGGVDPEVDDLNGFTLIAILFDYGLSWDTVVHDPDSPSQIFSRLPVLIDTALGITGMRSSRLRRFQHLTVSLADQVKPLVLQVWIPNSYKGPSDIS